MQSQSNWPLLFLNKEIEWFAAIIYYNFPKKEKEKEKLHSQLPAVKMELWSNVILFIYWGLKYKLMHVSCRKKKSKYICKLIEVVEIKNK